jgi:hypothetical protein
MHENDSEKRIYIGDCGCVRIESKHFRVTMPPEDFVMLLRRAAAEKRGAPFRCRLQISNNDGSTGFVSIKNSDKKR